jgi:hypothetical protein
MAPPTPQLTPSADGLDDRIVEPLERGQVLAPLLLDPAHHVRVLGQAVLALVEPPRRQDLDVGAVAGGVLLAGSLGPDLLHLLES